MLNKPSGNEFVRTKMPWIAGGALFLIYLLTINQWVSIRSLPFVSKVAGWDWSPTMQWPLFYLVTAPLRILPASLIPVAMNLLSALFMAATVGLLARSVALLPHDRTDEQRVRQKSSDPLLATKFAWAPVVLAAAVFGLELTVWEFATSATPEAVDILVFAYLIRCVLEYRHSKNERWLTKLAFVYGLGVTNNWALIPFFPFFLGSLIWIRGKSFFNPQFMLRMALFGLAGMLLYFMLPIIVTIKKSADGSFWEIFKYSLVAQKQMVFNTPGLRAPALILSLASIVPVIIMGIRFPAGFGDSSSSGAAITNFMFRVIHILFAVVCIWVAFDQVSPRTIGRGGLPFLTFYYLGALAAGYYIGYLMVVFAEPSKKAKMWRPSSPFSKVFNPVIQAAAWAAVALVPVALLAKNFKAASSQNGKILREFTETIVSRLPTKPAVLLSEDPFQLGLVEAWFAPRGGNPHMLVNPRMLPYPIYHADLIKRYGDRWPTGGTNDMKARIDTYAIASAMANLVKSNTVYYLHPSFGYFFELLQPEYKGIVSELKRYAPEVIYPPKMTAEQVKDNEQFWKSSESLVSKVQGLTRLKMMDATYIANHLSRSINTWGVELQRSGNFKDSGRLFESARDLNTNNVPAMINFEFNQFHLHGTPRESLANRGGLNIFGDRYRSWDGILGENGQFDAPEILYSEGMTMLQQSLVRQAADCFNRSSELEPTNTLPKLALVKTLIAGRWTNQALAMIKDLQATTNLTRGQGMDLVSSEAAVYYAQKDTNRAEALLLNALEKYPGQPIFLDSLSEMYRASRRWSNALQVMGRQVSIAPTNTALRLARVEVALNAGETNTALAEIAEVEKLKPGNIDATMFRIYIAIQEKDLKKAGEIVEDALKDRENNSQLQYYKGVVLMEQKEDEKAIEAFDKSLKAEPNFVAAIRNRAIVNLRASHWDAAKKDYEALYGIMPRSHQVLYGLGEVAYQKKASAEALKHYEGYLQYAPQDAPGDERAKVEARVKELKAAGK
jgi:tetratricopeptide (TPR) repeat protein